MDSLILNRCEMWTFLGYWGLLTLIFAVLAFGGLWLGLTYVNALYDYLQKKKEKKQ